MDRRNESGDDKTLDLCQASLMPKEHRTYSVYILASQKNGTLYIGVTGDLPTRIVQHQEQQKLGFTSRYNIGQIVWWEDFEDVQLAIQREKTIQFGWEIDHLLPTSWGGLDVMQNVAATHWQANRAKSNDFVG